MIAECVSSVNPRKEEFEGRVKEVEPFSATVREISTKQGYSRTFFEDAASSDI